MTTRETRIKIRENRMRRKAARCGLMLKKSTRRDHDAIDYGLWALVDGRTNRLVSPNLYDGYSMTIDEVERYFSAGKKKAVRR